MKKRIMTMLLALVMLISIVPLSALAECNDCQNAPYVPDAVLGKHIRLCKTCGNDFSAGPCTPDENGVCTLCKAQLNHTCNSDLLENLGAFHVYKCSLCRKEQGSRSGHKTGSYVSINPEQHAKICACGYQSNVKDHKDSNDDGKCDSCKFDMKNHTCTYEEGIDSNNNGTHTIKCSCGNSVTIKCLDNSGDDKCDSCGYQKYVHVCVGGKWTSNEDGTHSSKCSCGIVMDGPHPCQTINDLTCYMCGYDMHECDFEAGVTSNEDGTHNINCKCGKFVKVGCLDNDGDDKCDSCGYQKYVHVCVGGKWTSNNNGTHSSKCSCGIVMDGPHPCQTINDKTCYMCGYDMHECDFEAGVTSNEDGTHNINCSCGEFVKVACLDNDGDNKCDSCGYQKYVHICVGGKWTSNNDGTHTSKCSCGIVMDGPHPCQTINDKTCYMCGYVMHKCFAETKAVANKDGLSHSIVCAECNEFWKNEAHNWVNGVCTECFAETPFGTAPEQPDADEDKKCTFGQHDQMIELGCICPICGKCGHTFVEGTCLWCFAEEKNNSADNDPEKCEHPSGVSIDQEIIEATCEDDGYILTTKVCNECGEEYKIESPLGKAIGHNWYQTITAATCTEAGNEHYECANCSDYYDVAIPATGHKYVNGKCACGATESTADVEAACKHPSGVSVDQKVFEATCEKDGYILTKKVCNQCGETYEVTSPLGKALGHVWNQTITEASCDKAGNEHYQCANCGDYYDVAIPAPGHKYEHGVCTVCGFSNRPACRHWWTRTETVKAATCTETGLQNVICISCGHVTTEVTDMLSHNHVNGICTACGHLDSNRITDDYQDVFIVG